MEIADIETGYLLIFKTHIIVTKFVSSVIKQNN